MFVVVTVFCLFQTLAESLRTEASKKGLKASLIDLKDYDPEDNLADQVRG